MNARSIFTRLPTTLLVAGILGALVPVAQVSAGHSGPVTVTMTTGATVGGPAGTGWANTADTYTISIADSGGIAAGGSITVSTTESNPQTTRKR